MSLKEKYQINDPTWQKIKKAFNVGILLGIPFLAICTSGITWGVADNFTIIRKPAFFLPPWIIFTMLPCLIFYMISIVGSFLFFKRSKYTTLFLFLYLCLYNYLFALISSACCYRFFGFFGVLIQNIILLVTVIYLCKYYYSYWRNVWESHKFYNETSILDLKNGRFDFLNSFDISEGNNRNRRQQHISHSVLLNIIFTVIPVSVSIPLLFSKFDNQSIPILIAWFCSIPFILGWLKIVIGAFFVFRKITFYEKEIGKPIINGLLEK